MNYLTDELPFSNQERSLDIKARTAKREHLINHVTRVVLADDHARVRRGIRNLLENADDIKVVGEAGNGLEALNLVKKLKPDVLLLDMEMPVMNGNQVARELKKNTSSVRVLALSAHDDQEYIKGMLNSGAAGYLTKDEAPYVLLQAVRGVARGESGWVSQRIARKLARSIPPIKLRPSAFSEREIKILQMLAEHHSEVEIAEELNIDHASLQNQIETLFKKLEARTRLELIVRAVKENLI